MTNGQSGQRQASRHLTYVLHNMLVKSRMHQHGSQQDKRGKVRFAQASRLPSGDPQESTLWGEHLG